MTTNLMIIGGFFVVIFGLIYGLVRVSKQVSELKKENEHLGEVINSAKDAIESLNEPLTLGEDLLDDIARRSFGDRLPNVGDKTD